VRGMNASGLSQGTTLIPGTTGIIILGSSGVWRLTYSVSFATNTAAGTRPAMIFAASVNAVRYPLPQTNMTREVQFGDVTGTYQNINGWVDLSLNSGDAVNITVGTDTAGITMYVAAASMTVQRVRD
jgi:hypothetical protein